LEEWYTGKAKGFPQMGKAIVSLGKVGDGRGSLSVWEMGVAVRFKKQSDGRQVQRWEEPKKPK